MRRFKKRQLRKERKFFQKMEGSVAALLGFMCILLLAGGMYFFFSGGDDQIDAGGENGKGEEEGSNSKSCTEYECPTLYTKRDNAQYLETDDQDSPVNSCCVPRTCQLVDCSESARRSDPEKLTAVIDFIDKDNEDARVNFCCIATEESEELEKQKFWVIFWIVVASAIGLVAISGILTFNGWRGLIELPFMIVSVPANAILSLGKVLTGNAPRYGSGGGGGQPPDPNAPSAAVSGASARTGASRASATRTGQSSRWERWFGSRPDPPTDARDALSGRNDRDTPPPAPSGSEISNQPSARAKRGREGGSNVSPPAGTISAARSALDIVSLFGP